MSSSMGQMWAFRLQTVAAKHLASFLFVWMTLKQLWTHFSSRTDVLWSFSTTITWNTWSDPIRSSSRCWKFFVDASMTASDFSRSRCFTTYSRDRTMIGTGSMPLSVARIASYLHREMLMNSWCQMTKCAIICFRQKRRKHCWESLEKRLKSHIVSWVPKTSRPWNCFFLNHILVVSRLAIEWRWILGVSKWLPPSCGKVRVVNTPCRSMVLLPK